jgi:transglutaminase superfamily protein
MEDTYEKKLFEAMADYVKEKSQSNNSTKEELLLQSLHLTNYLGQSRSFIFNNREVRSIESSIIHPVTVDLMTAKGACGSYAYILCRLLKQLEIPTRIAQMKVNGEYGGHILVEAKTSKGWIVLDGSYDLYFKKPDGNLASFADVQANWEYYRSQVPANYDYNYSYEGVRYTNWEKIPVLMPLMKKAFSLFIGKERTEGFSLRTLFLRKFYVLFWATCFIYLMIVLAVLRRYMRKNRRTLTAHLSGLFSGKRTPSIESGGLMRRRA